MILFAFLLAVLDGTVVNAITGAPVAGADVSLRRAQRRVAVATTDSYGEFHIENVEDGDYTISGSAHDFYPCERLPLRVSGGSAPRLRVELTRFARLSGRVVDGDGRPVVHASVELIRTPRNVKSGASTDQNGGFVFDSVLDGTYQLSARATNLPPPKAAEGERLAWAPAFYDGPRIVVTPGVDLTGLEVRLRAVPVYRVRGTVLNPEGRGAAGVAIELSAAGDADRTEYATVSDAAGAFLIDGARDGQWLMVAKPAGSKLRGFGEARVTRSDVDDVAIRLLAPFPVEARVERDRSRNPKAMRAPTGVALQPVDGRWSRPSIGSEDQDGRIRIEDVYPGRYRISATGYDDDFYIGSIMLGDLDVSGQPADLGPGAPVMRIVYKPNPGRVRGIVENCEGCFVTLRPREELQLSRNTKCGSGGRFEIGGLRPGIYIAYAFEGDSFGIRRPLDASRAVKVEVRESETTEIVLRPSPGSDIQ